MYTHGDIKDAATTRCGNPLPSCSQGVTGCGEGCGNEPPPGTSPLRVIGCKVCGREPGHAGHGEEACKSEQHGAPCAGAVGAPSGFLPDGPFDASRSPFRLEQSTSRCDDVRFAVPRQRVGDVAECFDRSAPSGGVRLRPVCPDRSLRLRASSRPWALPLPRRRRRVVRPAQAGLWSGLMKVSGTGLAMSPAMQSGHLLRTLAQRQARQRRRAPARRGY